MVYGEERIETTRAALTAVSRVDAFVKEYDVDCEWTVRPTLDVCLTHEFANYASKAYEDSKAAGIDVDHVSVHEGEDAKRASRILMSDCLPVHRLISLPSYHDHLSLSKPSNGPPLL